MSKASIDENENGEKFIAYLDGDDEKIIKVDDLLDMMLGGYVQFKTISE